MTGLAVNTGELRQRIGAQMSRTQALKLRRLADEAYQLKQYANGLSAEEAERRIDALRAEIALADSF